MQPKNPECSRKGAKAQSIARGNIHHEGTKITKVRKENQKNFPNFVSFVRFVVRLEFLSATSLRKPREFSNLVVQAHDDSILGLS